MMFVLQMCHEFEYLGGTCKENGIEGVDIESTINPILQWLEVVR
jgi:hypothetical protein